MDTFFSKLSIVLCSSFLLSVCSNHPLLAQSPEHSESNSTLQQRISGSKDDSESPYLKAATYFQTEMEAARKHSEHEKEAALALNAARAYEMEASLGDPRENSGAEAAYRDAIAAAKQAANPEIRSTAVNNLAVLFLNEGRNHDALAAIADFDFRGVSKEEEALFLYNSGKVQEANADLRNAYADYLAAQRANPNLSTASDAAFHVLERSKTPRITDAFELSQLVFGRGCSEDTHNSIQQLLRMWGGDPKAQELLAALVQCYVAERTSLHKFTTEELPFIKQISITFPVLDGAISEIQLAYSGEMPGIPQVLQTRFLIWRDHGWMGETFAALLKMAGDNYEEGNDNQSALARYAAAWSITNEPKYALAFASLLSVEPRLDPDGTLLNGLLDSMFFAKGIYYEHGDWPNILRMHVAIGTILETRGNWGDSESPRSAIFQWEHALLADGQIRVQMPDLPPLAGVHMHLGNCYTRAQLPEKAGDEYVIAAESYSQVGDFHEAFQATKLARQVGSNKLSPLIQTRLYNVEDSLEKKCPGCA